MPDMGKVYNEIDERIKALEAALLELEPAGEDKAQRIAAYDLAIAKAIANLAMGKVKGIGGVPIDGKPPATLIPKYAAGMCSSERANVEIASNKYKSISTKVSVLSATLNAKQSLFRHIQ
jgi:hypothetical protein